MFTRVVWCGMSINDEYLRKRVLMLMLFKNSKLRTVSLVSVVGKTFFRPFAPLRPWLPASAVVSASTGVGAPAWQCHNALKLHLSN